MRIDLQEAAHQAVGGVFEAWRVTRCRVGKLSPIIVMTRKQRRAVGVNAFQLGQDAERYLKGRRLEVF